MRYYSEYLQKSDQFTEVFDGVYAVLHKLKKLNIKMGICTNKPGPTTGVVLENLGLIEFFDAIVTEDDVDYKKPDPRHLYQTINAVGLKPDESIFVGDSETDMETSSRAGVKFIFVTYGYCHVPFSKIFASKFINSFRELPGILTEVIQPK